MSFAPATVGAGNSVSHGNDSGLIVEFYHREKINQPASEAAGRPIYTSKPYVHIMIPGDKTTDVHRPVQDRDKQRFSRQWQAFLDDDQPVLDGTPLEEWTLLNVAQRAELKALNIRTIENLAEINDNLLDRIGFGAQKLRTMAREYIERAKGNVDNARFAREIEQRDVKIDLLTKQIAELSERLDQATRKPVVEPEVQIAEPEESGGSALDEFADLPEPTPVKRGRPRKNK